MFRLVSETNRLCFAKPDGAARSCKRPEIHRSNTITQLCTQWYSPKKGPLDTVYMCLHHHQSIIHHEPSWSKASHKFALAGAESSHYLSLHLVTTGDDPACCFMPARCSLRLRLVLLRRLTSVRICEISAFEAAECDRHKLVNSKIDT